METGYIAILFFIFISALVVPLFLLFSVIIRPKRRYFGKSGIPYECGEEPIGDAHALFNIRFYVISAIFLIFDVEIVTLFPCSLLFKSALKTGEGLSLFIKLLIFILILVFGLIYCWSRGDLEWLKTYSKK